MIVLFFLILPIFPMFPIFLIVPIFPLPASISEKQFVVRRVPSATLGKNATDG